MKESHMIECPWCEAKLESGIKHCPKCENEIIDFDSRQNEIVESSPVGGLLMLYAATCVISIFLIMYNYVVILRYGISVHNWTSYSAFIAIYNFIHLFILIVTILLIFKKRKFVPKLIVGFEVLNLVSLAISYFLANDLPQKALIMGATIKVVWLCLWICYFLFSKRVKQTFIH
ncbi:hypothetical protein QFZ81_001014 [Paenibacillus sp. V4I9]|uniref:DUF2569 family protein n=1 Tax=Paenibacillus sp. V4I9 TaxID=3042308 RepID=UPI00278360CB|nr:DUF2569 family protein [Paenibacillus sp. V4I9]MDQ0885926.1 hypothetical protein [Paenibacillus sp. V4I9]